MTVMFTHEQTPTEDIKPLVISLLVIAAVVGGVSFMKKDEAGSFDIRSRASKEARDCRAEIDQYFASVTPIPEPTKKAREYTKKLTACLLEETKR